MKHVNHFKIHMRTHRDFNGDSSNPLNGITEKKKQFLCSTCGRACTSRSNLAVHTRRHTGTMTNFCKICGKGYPRSTDLTIHMRWASNDNNTIHIRLSINIQMHFCYRKHTGEKPFVCSVCNRGFARSDKLTIHIRYLNITVSQTNNDRHFAPNSNAFCMFLISIELTLVKSRTRALDAIVASHR